MVQAATLAFLAFVSLTLVSFIPATLKIFPVQAWLVHRLNQRTEQQALRNYIQHVTPDERAIIAYLLAKNHKTFIAPMDGGLAKTLIARGIVRRPAQVFSEDEMVMFVPHYLWEVLRQHEADFTYTPPARGETENCPWYENSFRRIR